MKNAIRYAWALVLIAASTAAAGVVRAADAKPSLGDSALLYETKFASDDYGRIPLGWSDRIARRPNPNWIVDANGFLRPVVKGAIGFITYDGYLADGTLGRRLGDAAVTVDFKKTEDETCSFGVVVRARDAQNFYAARVVGDDRLQWVVVKDGVETVLTEAWTRNRYHDGEVWSLQVTVIGDLLSATLRNGPVEVQAAIRDATFKVGAAGLQATPYAATRRFSLSALKPFATKYSLEQIAERNGRARGEAVEYPIVLPLFDRGRTIVAAETIAARYDVVVAGAGTGGFAAAVQAARLGLTVLLLEETDYIGGQMAAAGVTTMDEDSVWMKFPVRERGIYREFHESMVAYYRTLNKDPFVAYYGNPQMEGGYEPRVAQAVLYGLLADAQRGQGRVDVSLRSIVTAVRKDGDKVVGVAIEVVGDAITKKEVACGILIDATEYGDVLPLTGARYRVSNCISDAIDLKSPIQDHTWTAIVKEYPEGVPEHLQIKAPPPGYEDDGAKRYRKFQRYGLHAWGAQVKGIKGPRDNRVFFAWRGMADSFSPLTGLRSELRHTRCGFNGGNDYPVSAATCEDPQRRKIDERAGIYKTLGALYYFQRGLGLDWSLAADEGYDTPAQRAKIKSLELRSDLEPIAYHLPQMPYVRESRRMIGVDTLKAIDLGRYEHARHVTTSIAMGDYFMDLDHGKTAHVIEPDLDGNLGGPEALRGGGPFQVPFEVLIPEKLDGFLCAEKNFSQSRIANGATRLQPITMLTGQAVGTIAALAVKQGKQPRDLKPIDVQAVLLDSGSTLIQRWYADVPWGAPIWKATQLLSLYEVLDRPGAIEKDNNVALGATAKWGVDAKLSADEQNAAVRRLQELRKAEVPAALVANDGELTVAEFAVAAADFLCGGPGNVKKVAAAKKEPSAAEAALVDAEVSEQSPLTPAEADRLDELRTTVQKSPELKAASDKWKAARKAYQVDRAKYPNERSPEVAKAYRDATKEYEAATTAAMIAADPQAAALLKKKPPAKNEGENASDSGDPRSAAMKPIVDDPKLPRVLLIGDSISIGYTTPVRTLLKGKANVHRIPINGGATEVGLERIKEWLGDGRWDVIHFNFGLHDAKYMSPTEQRASREQYLANLRRLVEQMRARGAKLIFATTTPVPPGIKPATRRFDSIPERNKLAVALMGELGVAIDDLYSVVLPVMDKVGRPHDVHYAPEGYDLLGKAVAESIEKALAQ